jgi:hypothetical protein
MPGDQDNQSPINLPINQQTGREISQPRTSVRVSPGTSRMPGDQDNQSPINLPINQQTAREISQPRTNVRAQAFPHNRIGRPRRNQTIVPRRINRTTARRRIDRLRRNQTIVPR